MKPVSWIFLIVSVILIVVGVLMCSIATLQAKKQDVSLFDTETVDGEPGKVYDFSEDTINKLQVEVNDCDVNIICGAEESKAIMKNFSSAGYVCEVENRTLVIEDTVNLFDVKNIIETGNIRFKGFRYYLRDRKVITGRKSLDVYISDKFDIKIIDITVKSGDVKITGYENNTDYTVKITKGNLVATDIVTASEVTATIGNGTATLDNITAKTVNVSLDEGNINAVLAANEITADTKKGSVNIESKINLSEYSFFLEAPDGNIMLENLVKLGMYRADDAMLKNFIHSSAGGGNITVKTFIAPEIPAGEETETEPETEQETEAVTYDFPPITAAAE